MLELLEQNGLTEKIKNNIQFRILGLYGQTLHQPKPFVYNALHNHQKINIGTLRTLPYVNHCKQTLFKIPKVLKGHPFFKGWFFTHLVPIQVLSL